MMTEFIRDWATSPHTKAFYDFAEWYTPEIDKVRARQRANPYRGDLV